MMTFLSIPLVNYFLSTPNIDMMEDGDVNKETLQVEWRTKKKIAKVQNTVNGPLYPSIYKEDKPVMPSLS